MRINSFFFIFWAVIFTINVHAKVSCAQVFANESRDLSGEKQIISVNGNDRELWVFRPNLRARNRAPVMIYFHGTNHPVELSHPHNAPFGLAHEITYIQTLMDAGFVVLAPKANTIVPFYIGPQVVAWEANVAPYSSHFKSGRDYNLTTALLSNLESITELPVDRSRIFFSGFSSGGYMSSRLAQDPDMAKQVKGIIVHSASYGECIASQCSIPRDLPDWHPPTLLVANKDDSIVPFYTVELYLNRLQRNNILVDTQFSEKGDHAWSNNHSAGILSWVRKLSAR